MLNFSGSGRIARALRNPNYGIYTAGNAVSLIGTWMQRVAVGWLTWQLTHSGAWLGVIAFANLFPTVFVAPIAGAAADRWDRLRVTKISQSLAMAQSVLLFGLTASGLITIELLLLLTAFLGVVAAFNQPARLALIPSLVRREDLSAAIAINSIIFNSARFLGPAAAGLIIVSGGIAATFAVNAATFIAFLVALARIRLAGDGEAMPRSDRSLMAESVEGLRYAATHAGIAPLLLLLTIICICARPFVELLPGFAADVFGAGAQGLAWLTSTVGIGAMAGGLWLAQRSEPRGLTLIALGSTFVLGISLLLFVASDRLWLAVPALAVAGFCLVTSGVGTQTLLQHSVEPAMRGRVLSLYGLIFRGGPALGALVMGAASDAAGLRWPLAVGAALSAAVAAYAWTRRHGMATALEAGDALGSAQQEAAR